MQQLEGDGLSFVHAGGTIVEKELAAGRIHEAAPQTGGGVGEGSVIGGLGNLFQR